MKPNFTLQEKRDFAKQMRHNMTRAEQALWWKLSRNQFGYRFCRQFPLRGYIVDFYCARLRLVIEIDGSVHENEEIAADDEQRERILESYGFLVLRFTNEEVLDHMTVVLTRLWDECSARRAALKAFDPRGVVSERERNQAVHSRPCVSVENTHRAATVDKLSVDAGPRIPATAEDNAALNEAWRELVECSRLRSMSFLYAQQETFAKEADLWKQRRALLKAQAQLVTPARRLETAGQLTLPIFGDGTAKKLAQTEEATMPFKGMEVEQA